MISSKFEDIPKHIIDYVDTIGLTYKHDLFEYHYHTYATENSFDDGLIKDLLSIYLYESNITVYVWTDGNYSLTLHSGKESKFSDIFGNAEQTIAWNEHVSKIVTPYNILTKIEKTL